MRAASTSARSDSSSSRSSSWIAQIEPIAWLPARIAIAERGFRSSVSARCPSSMARSAGVSAVMTPVLAKTRR